jgi:hypothetical protein
MLEYYNVAVRLIFFASYGPDNVHRARFFGKFNGGRLLSLLVRYKMRARKEIE